MFPQGVCDWYRYSKWESAFIWVFQKLLFVFFGFLVDLLVCILLGLFFVACRWFGSLSSASCCSFLCLLCFVVWCLLFFVVFSFCICLIYSLLNFLMLESATPYSAFLLEFFVGSVVCSMVSIFLPTVSLFQCWSHWGCNRCYWHVGHCRCV